MKNTIFDMWCAVATGKIGYLPDRRAVSDELRAHLEDHRDALMEQGMDEDEASKTALDAMGKAHELAPLLAAVHKPFWGYALLAGKVLLVIVLCLTFLPIWNYINSLRLTDTANHRDFAVYDAASYGGDTGRTLHHLSQPDVSSSSDGYRFTVTDVAVFTEYSESLGRERTELYMQIDQRSPLPWTETARYYSNFLNYTSPCCLFTVTDSLGNFYYSYASHYRDDPALQVIACQSGLFTGTNECWINDFPADAEWIDICYQRDGRDFTLRVWLTGGDAA